MLKSVTNLNLYKNNSLPLHLKTTLLNVRFRTSGLQTPANSKEHVISRHKEKIG